MTCIQPHKPNKYMTNENGNDRKGELTYQYQNLPKRATFQATAEFFPSKQTQTPSQIYQRKPSEPPLPAKCENKIDIDNKLMMIKKESRMEEAAKKIPP